MKKVRFSGNIPVFYQIRTETTGRVFAAAKGSRRAPGDGTVDSRYQKSRGKRRGIHPNEIKKTKDLDDEE
jgi:hypothetical protein